LFVCLSVSTQILVSTNAVRSCNVRLKLPTAKPHENQSFGMWHRVDW